MMRYDIEETAVYDKYVRWCGRTGPQGPSYPIPRPSEARRVPLRGASARAGGTARPTKPSEYVTVIPNGST